MANQTFAGWEVVIKIAGATVGVAEFGRVTLKNNLERVPQLGSRQAADIKEGSEDWDWSLRRAYFVDAGAADFFAKAKGDANGYLTSFTMTLEFVDKSSGTPATKTITLTGCKVDTYGKEFRAGRGVVIEELSGLCLSGARA